METKPLQHSSDFITLCNAAKQRINEITVDEVEKTLLNDNACYLIDVREKDEVDAGHIANAHFLSKGWIEAKIHQIVTDKTANIILYCGGGHRSALSADNLQKMGYINVHSMQGGIKAWIRAGKKILK